MGMRDKIKRILPSYRTEKRMLEKLEAVRKDLREMDNKSEYLFWLSQMQPGETMQQTKERLFLQMPKATGRLRNIQIAENYILQRVKKICDENGLHFFLIGGTLLGAVRHKGFIPWDNDIDIGMMKDDYEKLRGLLSKDEELSLEYYYKYAEGLKISKVKFRATEVFFIDIFVFDFIVATQETVDRVWKKTQQLNTEHRKGLQELAKSYTDRDYCRPVANPALDLEAGVLEQKMFGGLSLFGQGEFFCETLDSPYWSRVPRGMLPREMGFPLAQDAVEFEGMLYDVWNRYDQALENMYGDIWRLPFSVREPHTTEFDEGFDEAINILKNKGILV